MFNTSLQHEIKAQADAFDRGTEQKKQAFAEGYSTYGARKLHDIPIKKASACHLFHTQSENAAVKEFLKPLYLLQLIPKARAEAPDEPIHYLTAGEKGTGKGKTRPWRGERQRQSDDISNLYLLLKWV